MKKTGRILSAVVALLLLTSCCNVEVDKSSFLNSRPIEEVAVVNDISDDTSLAESIKYADAVGDKCSIVMTDDRRGCNIENNHFRLILSLADLAEYGYCKYYFNAEHGHYEGIETDVFYTDIGGKKHYVTESSEIGRVNVIRMGEYYNECHVRDLDFGTDTFKLDSTYHLYGDRVYNQMSLYASEATSDLAEFGIETIVSKDCIAAVEIKDKDGVHCSFNKFDSSTVEYIAIDVKGVGVFGFIIPNDGSTASVTVEEGIYNYIIRHTADYNSGTAIKKYDGTGEGDLDCVTFGARLWTESGHSFEMIAKASEEERNPLEKITVNGGNADGKYIGYDNLSGAYMFSMKGTDFNTAYNDPDLHYTLPVSVESDSDRQIYIRVNGDNGCLEAGAVLDDTDTLVPINVQVSKNFQGDGGEEFYSFNDYQYGDSIIPLSLKAGESIDFTLLNMYQNWGKYPLKQLSSIEFHIPYYHLSTGVTETNCIAPYFVFGVDGWTLPDFRTRSGDMWEEQPQYNSVGILKFAYYRDSVLGLFNEPVYNCYDRSNIDSVGQTYSDITSQYFLNTFARIELRHVEFPQTDENRTYYTLGIKFFRDVTFDNFRRDFDLFYFDGRFVKFNKAGYLNEDNQSVTVDVSSRSTEYYTLGNDAPYWGFYGITDDTKEQIANHFGSNFAMIIKDSRVVIGGEEQNVPFVFRNSSDKDVTSGALTLDKKKIEFSAGDSITVDMILLPWGTGFEESCEQVLAVREDSALNNVAVSASTGTVINDSFLPTIKCKDNEAEFTLKGGRNNIAVRVDGFTSLRCPDIYKKTDSGWEKVELASVNGYDGYSVYYNDDGTYGFSFVYTAENIYDSHTFRLEQK